jgi:hypothetical protein
MEIGILLTIISILFALYYLQSRAKQIINDPDKKFKKLISKFDKNIDVDVQLQQNKLNLKIFNSVLLGENNVLISLSNTSTSTPATLITNVPLINRGYNEPNKEYLVFNRNIKQTAANIDVILKIWLNENNCIRYEFSDPHRE